MKIQTLLLATVATLFVVAGGCSDDMPGTTTSSSSSGGSSSTSSGGTAMMPALGAQVDRMGRAAINTAGNATFEPDPEKADMSKNAYNTASDPAKWKDFTPEVQKNLAILDSLDANCGNQLAADKTKMDASRYAPLAGVLVDDRLYVNAAGTTCGAYLGVEANALQVLPNMDCGGRTLAYDVIDTSYSVLAAGILTGVDDTIKISDAAKGTIFPYLTAPH